jgi:uncharacterized metal-binding protein
MGRALAAGATQACAIWMNEKNALPLVYSCSGASSAAQMANLLAVKLDRSGAAEMSCIAGVGGDVAPLVKVATSGRPIVALDGCALRCVLHILKRHNIAPAAHFMLREYGVKKQAHADFSPGEAENVLEQILANPQFPRPTSPAP